MTDAAKPEPGWYIITAPDGEMSCQRFGVRPYDYKFGLHLPHGCTLGPRVEDLLRDVERYRWLRETDYRAGMDANNGEVYYAWPDEKRHEKRYVLAQEFDALIDAEIAREKAGRDG